MQRTHYDGTRCLTVYCLFMVYAISLAESFGYSASLESKQTFDKSVARILAAHCLKCHNGSEPKANLNLSGKESLFKGGESGPAVHPGNPEKSLLWSQLVKDEMPPKYALDPSDKEIIRKWIADGAEWGTDPINPFLYSSKQRAGYDWWSLQPLKGTQVPRVEDGEWPENEIDHFILSELDKHELDPSPRAHPRTLVRRLYIDLIGLPPPVEIINQYVNKPSKEAWEKIVDDLLASPHYGERWARHWMDVVRFGETDGYEYNRPRNHSWHFRDWLIRSFNDDLPYDTFSRMQLAGDVISGDSYDGAAAVGFLVAGAHNTILGVNPVMKLAGRHDEFEELAGTIGQTFLGLTINCARCHDHKFDPISMREYYSFIATLDGVYHGERKVNIPKKEATDEQTLYTVISRKPGIMKLYERGDVSQPTHEVKPGGIAALKIPNSDFYHPKVDSDGERRKRLANWITHNNNALFQRVAVNRIWHYHFGKGIVDSPSDFGFNGGRPTHPELLDWLASWFRDNGYSLKKLHKLILLSSTYQQESNQRSEGLRIDPDNRFLWRQNPRRVEAEVLRDSILAISGQLNPKLFGPGYFDVKIEQVAPAFYYTPIDPIGEEFNRRTLYRWNARGQRSALLDSFDCPDPSTKTPVRMVTTTPSQALSQWNDTFILRMSKKLSQRIKVESGESVESKVLRSWELVLGRFPNPREKEKAISFVQKHELELLCRVLFNSNEFIFVD